VCVCVCVRQGGFVHPPREVTREKASAHSSSQPNHDAHELTLYEQWALWWFEQMHRQRETVWVGVVVGLVGVALLVKRNLEKLMP